MSSGTSSPRNTTVVGPPAGERALVWGGFPLLGAGAGWLLKSVAGWVVSLPWAPFQGPFKLAASFPEPQATIGGLALGVLAGLVIAFLAEQDNVTATIDDSQVTLTRGDSSRTVPRASIAAVFLDGKQLVLLGHETQQHARMGDAPHSRRLEAAFRAHGYPWRADGDPHASEYRRWVDDLPDLPAGANALFKARERALQKDNHTDIDELRNELAGMGIVVREENKRQYWRRTGQGPERQGGTAPTSGQPDPEH